MILNKNKMKKAILIISLSVVFAISGLIPAFAQDQPKPQKDTVNIDTDAKPTLYYDIEDDATAAGGNGKSSTGTIAIVAGIAIIIGGVTYYLLRKKK
jgi:LPXTG-motif cell wall-anchored protein